MALCRGAVMSGFLVKDGSNYHQCQKGYEHCQVKNRNYHFGMI